MRHSLSTSRVLPALLSAALLFPLFLPAGAAQARAGRGWSMGSRGSHTWSAPPSTPLTPYGVRPMQRSYTPAPERPYTPPPAAAPYGTPNMMGARPVMRPPMGAGMGMARPSFTQRHPFMTGFAGGLLGAGLVGMLSGHGFFGGFTGGSSFLGFLFQAALLGLLIMWVMRLWRRPSGSAAPARRPGMVSGGAVSQPVTLSPDDYRDFEKLLLNIENAWSAENLTALRSMTTPEMASYFSQQLSELSSQGARNVVSQVHFISGELAEAWREGNLVYATVAMRYSMIDVTTDSLGNVIEGNPDQPVTVTELWTFVRADNGRGNWVLSAIQQPAS
ncbi:Tim44 domain-containing protein [Oecophyllibacter saccharovorans]|uniref:Tim44 domain-containing protein n=1 Tax=Oecophyllibacter saccharovorans TaxID=2558360 RepID=UPI00116F9029|nr:Tim44-like domain-containing protein [Oecophyllibacter saccharovorans]TPW36712.1 Tim44 domain-containing protein [Oecophyllibacter saccharovorans]